MDIKKYRERKKAYITARRFFVAFMVSSFMTYLGLAFITSGSDAVATIAVIVAALAGIVSLYLLTNLVLHLIATVGYKLYENDPYEPPFEPDVKREYKGD